MSTYFERHEDDIVNEAHRLTTEGKTEDEAILQVIGVYNLDELEHGPRLKALLSGTRKPRVFKTRSLPVYVGDVIFAKVGVCGLETVRGKVVDIERQWALGSGGTVQHAPLLIVMDFDTGKRECFCSSYVTEIVQRSTDYHLPKNTFRDAVVEDPNRFLNLKTLKKSLLQGSLVRLASFFLAKMSLHLDRRIDEEKLSELFLKQTPGLVESLFAGVYVVRKKAFGNWVRKNALKICMTASKMQGVETRINQDFWDDMDRDLSGPESFEPEDEVYDPDEHHGDECMSEHCQALLDDQNG